MDNFVTSFIEFFQIAWRYSTERKGVPCLRSANLGQTPQKWIVDSGSWLQRGQVRSSNLIPWYLNCDPYKAEHSERSFTTRRPLSGGRINQPIQINCWETINCLIELFRQVPTTYFRNTFDFLDVLLCHVQQHFFFTGVSSALFFSTHQNKFKKWITVT